MCTGGKYEFSKWFESVVSRAILTVGLGSGVHVFYLIGAQNHEIAIAFGHR